MNLIYIGFVLTVAVSCTIFGILRLIRRKSVICNTSPVSYNWTKSLRVIQSGTRF